MIDGANSDVGELFKASGKQAQDDALAAIRIAVDHGEASLSHGRAAVAVSPVRLADSNATASDKYTRRPRKRTDMAIVRLRHRLQQKLKRDS
ncbi:hypothetical protein TPL01_32660 [Sulfuriferula plumbiphila]|uniref:Uncharacterized protein n=1 Tax=Sulfuriferula plumbiphila TaxID=171865 RepID=A0A512LCB0_9PROT|nr:hypothetical protein SFPGR_21860 [Sulfuriferula plumbiphila]GEP32128.1 hypothetical protein TPL01_32660 [Sulfuriferula plumbiphila]